MGSPSRNVQYHPPRLSEDRLNLPQPHSPSLPTHCSGKSGMRPLAVERHPLADDPFRACRLVHRYFLRVAFDEPEFCSGSWSRTVLPFTVRTAGHCPAGSPGPGPRVSSHSRLPSTTTRSLQAVERAADAERARHRHTIAAGRSRHRPASPRSHSRAGDSCQHAPTLSCSTRPDPHRVERRASPPDPHHRGPQAGRRGRAAERGAPAAPLPPRTLERQAARHRLDIPLGDHRAAAVRTLRRPRQPHVDHEARQAARAPPRTRLPTLGMRRRKMSPDQTLAAHDTVPCLQIRRRPNGARALSGCNTRPCSPFIRRRRPRTRIAHHLPRPIRRQPHQPAGLAHICLTIPRRTLPVEPPQVPVLAARARRDHELLLRHQPCRRFSSPSASRWPRTASSVPSPTLTTRVP